MHSLTSTICASVCVGASVFNTMFTIKRMIINQDNVKASDILALSLSWVTATGMVILAATTVN